MDSTPNDPSIEALREYIQCLESTIDELWAIHKRTVHSPEVTTHRAVDPVIYRLKKCKEDFHRGKGRLLS